MRNFLDSLKASGALKWLLVWGGVILAALLAIHFFSKKGAASNGGSGGSGGSATPDSQSGQAGSVVSNTTYLVNGYPPQVVANNIPTIAPGGSPSGAAGPVRPPVFPAPPQSALPRPPFGVPPRPVIPYPRG